MHVPDVTLYGCHCELEEDSMPDACVLDTGGRCLHAIKLEGKDRSNCKHWQVINFGLYKPQ